MIVFFLNSRGADIFNRLISDKINKDRKREERILEKVRTNLDRIRKHQSTIAGIKEPTEHYETIRSGDYYMFDEQDNVDEFELDSNEANGTDIVDANPNGIDQVDMKLSKKSKNSKEKLNKNDENIQLDTSDGNNMVIAVATAAAAGSSDNDNDENSSEKLKALHQIKKYLIDALEYIIEFFNKYSHDFRQVSKTLTKEKYLLRTNEFKANENESKDLNNTTFDRTTTTTILNNSNVIKNEMDEVDAEYDLRGKPLVYRLFNSIYYLILSQSELVCYFLMILTHLLSASILSLPLPLSVFLWSLLCIPRPPHTYWITCITYTEVNLWLIN